MIEFFFTSPASSTMPIMLIRLSVSPNSHSVASAPVTPNGTAISTVNGWTNELNCTPRIMYATTKPSASAHHRLSSVSFIAWALPSGTMR